MDTPRIEPALLLPPRPVRSPPEPSANGHVRDGFMARLLSRIFALISFFRPRWRGLTPMEARLQSDNDRLRQALWDRESRIFQLEHDLARRDSENKILQCEVQLWTEVHFRDRARNEADQNIYTHITALAQGALQRPSQ